MPTGTLPVNRPGPANKHYRTYLLVCNGYVKIGKTEDIMARLHAIEQYICPAWPHYLVVAQSYQERELHIRFKDYHVGHEWFKLCPEIETILEELQVEARINPNMA